MLSLFYIFVISSFIYLILHFRYFTTISDTKIKNEKVLKEIKYYLEQQGIKEYVLRESERLAESYKRGEMIYIGLSKEIIDHYRTNIIISIIGHELGHIVLNHTNKMIIVNTITLTIFLYSAYMIYQINYFYFPLLIPIYYIKQIIDMYFSRLYEYQADLYSVRTNGKENFIVTMKKIKHNFINDKKSLLSTHPTIEERIKKYR